jgi:hypothetical protein
MENTVAIVDSVLSVSKLFTPCRTRTFDCLITTHLLVLTTMEARVGSVLETLRWIEHFSLYFSDSYILTEPKCKSINILNVIVDGRTE